jgi:hypothetical protein
MSSHREAPEISKDPVADNTDVYAFVSPDRPDTVTIVANWLPFEGPSGGPNFYEFGDDVLYSIYIDNDGDAKPEIEYQFQFSSSVQNPNTFLYNTGPIGSLTDPNWNARQTYSVTRIDAGKGKHGSASDDDVSANDPSLDTGSPAPAGPGPAFPNGRWHATTLGTNLSCPPSNIGPRSTPNYEANLATPAIQNLPSGETVFAGQRSDPFYVDVGSIFDLGALRPFNAAHLIPMAATNGVDDLKALNVQAIVLQVPITMLTQTGMKPTGVSDPNAVLGIFAAASRRKARVLHNHKSKTSESGPWVQISRLGNPLFNEVIVPLGQKDDWNHDFPQDDSEYLPLVQKPELQGLLPVLYPGAFPNLAGITGNRDDLAAILMTGLPAGIIPGFQNYTGSTPADLLRLNVAIPPSGSPSALGLLGGDLAGYPNGRRLADDIVAIELRAIAGLTYPLVKPSYTPDAAAGALTQGIPTPATDGVGSRYMTAFPYVGSPYDGYDTPSS